jgi:hypothetical protein
LSPLTLLIGLPILAGHFLTWRFQQHSIVYHYTALVTPFVVAAAIIGLRNLSEWAASSVAAIGSGGARGARTHGRARTGAQADRAHGAGRKVTLAVACGVALACSVASQLLFGPFAAPTSWRRLSPAEPVRPGLEARALRPHRERLLASLPREGGVVASFEFLSHLTRRAEVHSLHNLLTGKYTFSGRPYPVPSGVTGMIADFGALATQDAVLGSGARLRELCRVNGLKPVRAAGDLVAFARGARDTLPLFEAGAVERPDTRPILYDGQLALLGVEPLDRDAGPGDTLGVRVVWKRVAAVDRLFLMRLMLRDDKGQVAYSRRRNVGYGLYPVHDWPADAPVTEIVRFVVPEGLSPGRYELAFAMEWRMDNAARGESVADDPERGQLVRVGWIGRLGARR